MFYLAICKRGDELHARVFDNSDKFVNLLKQVFGLHYVESDDFYPCRCQEKMVGFGKLSLCCAIQVKFIV